jgi:hypothetical protein
MTEEWVKCEYCGTDNLPDRPLCTHCGAPLKHPEEPQLPERQAIEPLEEEEETGEYVGPPLSKKTVVFAFVMLAIIGPSIFFGFPLPLNGMFHLIPSQSVNVPYQPDVFFTRFNIEIRSVSGVAIYQSTPPGISVLWYHHGNGQWDLEPNSDYFNIRQSDDYIAFAAVKSSSNSCYIDYQRTIASQSPLISHFAFVDVDSDGLPETVFQFNLRQLPVPSEGYPSLAFCLYLLPISQTVVMTSMNATKGSLVSLLYSIVLDNETDGLAIYKVQVQVNDTTQANCVLKVLVIPEIGGIAPSSMMLGLTPYETFWAYAISATLEGALYLKGRSAFEAEFSILGSAAYEVTLSIYYLLPTGAGAKVSNTTYILGA